MLERLITNREIASLALLVIAGLAWGGVALVRWLLGC